MIHPRNSPLVLFIAVVMFSMTACQSDKNNQPKQQVESQQSKTKEVVATLRPLVSAGDSKIVEDAYLRKNLPESAFAYARIPNPWSFIGSAKGNVFDKANNSKPIFDAINGIRTGLIENVIPEIPEKQAQLMVKLLFSQLTSPLEAIAISGVDPAIPTPNLVLTTAADFSSSAEVQAILETLAEQAPALSISKAMDANGYAELSIAHMSAQLQWNQQIKRLTLLLGVSLSPNNLTEFIKTLQANSNHSMLALEETIDQSGQGVFAWADPRKLTSMAATMGMQQQMAPLAMVGINNIKNIAVGAGTSNGINRLKYVVDMPVTGFRNYMPIVKTSPEFKLAGKTKGIGVFGLPSRADFVSIENTIALVTPAKDMEKYYSGKKKFKETLGFSVDDIFEFFGQDISIVSDEAGIYAAIRFK